MTSVLDRRVIAISEDRKRDVGDGRGDELAVVQQLVEIFVARFRHVLTAAVDQRDERALRNREMLQRVGECDRDRMRRMSVVTGIELALPLIEPSEWRAGVLAAAFIDDVVGPTAIRIRRVHRTPFQLRKESKSDGEVCTVFVRDRATERVSLAD